MSCSPHVASERTYAHRAAGATSRGAHRGEAAAATAGGGRRRRRRGGEATGAAAAAAAATAGEGAAATGAAAVAGQQGSAAATGSAAAAAAAGRAAGGVAAASAPAVAEKTSTRPVPGESGERAHPVPALPEPGVARESQVCLAHPVRPAHPEEAASHRAHRAQAAQCHSSGIARDWISNCPSARASRGASRPHVQSPTRPRTRRGRAPPVGPTVASPLEEA